MEKLVVKTAVKTVLIILGVLIVVFAVFNFAFPQHMATVTESMGNYSLAVKYASLRYHYTKDCDDLARCFDDSVLCGNDKYVLDYGNRLIEHQGYEQVCREKNLRQTGSRYDYDHWVMSKIAVSTYNTGKPYEAIQLAAADNGTESFEDGNALMAVCVRIKGEKDKDAATEMVKVLEGIHPVNSTESGSLTEFLAVMSAVARG